MASKVWQHPYVNIFKHLKIEEWKRSTKEGDVSLYMDKTLRCSAFRIKGSTPASNYILVPKVSAHSLGLTGRYFYLLFRPTPSKYFVVHLDVAVEGGVVVRIAFSNMFKDFKSTATSLQFPFICGAAKDSVYESTVQSAKHDLVGPAPSTVRWTCLSMDLHYILSVYLNRRHAHLKSVKLCSNMAVKNMFTSDLLLDPGLSFSEAKQRGLSSSQGTGPTPRDMSFPVPKGQRWHHLYDYIRCPSEGAKMPFDSIQKDPPNPGSTCEQQSPVREVSSSGTLIRPGKDHVSLIQQLTVPRRPPRAGPPVVPELPDLHVVVSREDQLQQSPRDSRSPGGSGAESSGTPREDGDGGTHVYVHQSHAPSGQSEDGDTDEMVGVAAPRPVPCVSAKPTTHMNPRPDPILRLNRVIGFGGGTARHALWTRAGDEVVYPCHAIVVSMNISSGRQKFFIGHTDKVSALAFDASTTLLASAQTGRPGAVRLWDYNKGSCLVTFKTHHHSVSSLSFSFSGNILCGVGKDGHNKTLVVVWDTAQVSRPGEAVSILAKAHTDVDIRTMKVAHFDDTRMVSCGRDNIRLWRMRGGALRSCPVDLEGYHSLDFTDVAFRDGPHGPHGPEAPDRTLYVSSLSGHILEVDYGQVLIKNVRRLQPSQPSHGPRRDKWTFNTGPGIAINSISFTSAFCATGSEDGFLRLWPLDFSSVFLEAEHEGPVSLVAVSDDGLRVLAATSTGNLGYLDVSSHGYSTLMRSHARRVLAFSCDGVRRHLATASEDGSVRVWHVDSLQQLYDFVSEDCPCAVAFHPSLQVFSCGFSSGLVRVFDVRSAKMLAEHGQHRGPVLSLLFSPSGEFMYSTGAAGFLVLYNADDDHTVLKVQGNAVAHGTARPPGAPSAPGALAVSRDSRCLGFIGPSEYVVTLADARTLDELLRVDVSILDVASSRLDAAVSVCFSPLASDGTLLVATSAHKVLWISTKTGQLLREVSEVHKKRCVSLEVSEDSRFLLTAGDDAIKVWDYRTLLDVSAQKVIGHTPCMQQVGFTPDQMGVVSVGDAIFLWDFLPEPVHPLTDSRSPSKTSSAPPLKLALKSQQRPKENGLVSSNGMPRRAAPLPSFSPPRWDISAIDAVDQEVSGFLSLCEDPEGSPSVPVQVSGPSPSPGPGSGSSSFLRVTELSGSSPPRTTQSSSPLETESEPKEPIRPDCYKHFTPRYKTSVLDPAALAPPPGEEGLRLKAVIGYNGNGRDNMVWRPDTGVFAYSCGCVLVLENLHTGVQRHLVGHTEEISTLASAHDSLTVASAAAGRGGSRSLICIWNVQSGACRNTVSYHRGAVQSMAFSRDDLLFLSVGDFSDPVVALWSSRTFQLLHTVRAEGPLHHAAFSPSRASRLACVGSQGALFCLLDSQLQDVDLKVQRVTTPAGLGGAKLTSMCYGADSLLFTGSGGGHVCVWDCQRQRCFMTWRADEGEIGVLLCRGQRLLTGSNTRRLRLWCVAAVEALRLDVKAPNTTHSGARVLLEQEILLDGTVVSAAFDEALHMGIVGTTAGTLWYINWLERSSIRLISGHKTQVNGVAFSADEMHFATCGEDGSLRVWSAPSRELVVQFQVLNQGCSCVCWTPAPARPPGVCVAAGYSDGTVRVFRLASGEMDRKLRPHRGRVSALQYSAHGHMILSAGEYGLVAVSNPEDGSTVRVLNDHRGAAVTCLQCVARQFKQFGLEGNELWLAASSDRRVSVWVADWPKIKCDLLDWLTFPAPVYHGEGESPPPSMAAFCPTDPGLLVYTGYAADKDISFYSLARKQVIRKISLPHWASCLSLSPKEPLIAVGSTGRVLKLIRSPSGRFQDFLPHSDALQALCFSPSGGLLFSLAYDEIYLWEVKGLASTP